MESENQIQKDLEQLRAFLLKDNLFNYAVLRKVIIMDSVAIVMLGDFRKDIMSQAQRAVGYARISRKTLDLDVTYSPYTRTVRISVGRINVELTMGEIEEILTSHEEEESDG
jgi:hypothetical protein